MTFRQFLVWLMVTTAITIGALALMYEVAPHTRQIEFSSFFTTIMIGLSVTIYLQARQAAQSPNLYDYSRKFLAFTGLKMLICVLVIIAYKYIFPEVDKNYLYSFLIIYVMYTVLETSVFMKLSKPE